MLYLKSKSSAVEAESLSAVPNNCGRETEPIQVFTIRIAERWLEDIELLSFEGGQYQQNVSHEWATGHSSNQLIEHQRCTVRI